MDRNVRTASSGPMEIAVVGLGCVFPDAVGVDGFWKNVLSGRDSVSEVPRDRWDPEVFFDPDPGAPDKTYCKIGAFVRDWAFDPLRYQIPPRTALQMDRTQQMAIVAADEAIRDAGLERRALSEGRTAVILGNTMGGESTDRAVLRVYARWLAREIERLGTGKGNGDGGTGGSFEQGIRALLDRIGPSLTEDSLPGELPNVIAGRVAAVFDLNGQNCVVDAACASAMAAVAEAVRLLRAGEADTVLAGGVDCNMSPAVFVKFSKLGALSPDGIRPFDRRANGFVMGEGAGILILKRLEDALQNGDRIYCVIKAVGASSDGRGKGITAPNPMGQKRAIERALAAGGISPSTISLVEAHGTGTPVGDRTELQVLQEIWRAGGAGVRATAIGSVKSQIGHLKSAAGAASLIKVALALFHGVLPPTIHCTEPLDGLDGSDGGPFYVPSSPTPWPDGVGPRRAATSAFGFGGTNFHLILEQGPARAERVETSPPEIGAKAITLGPGRQVTCFPLVLAAENRARLREDLAALCRKPLSAATVAQLSAREAETSLKPARAALVAWQGESLEARVGPLLPLVEDPQKDKTLASRGVHIVEGPPLGPERVAFLFPGQGSQYPFMLADLLDPFPVVRRTFEEADRVLAGHLDLPLSHYVFSSSGPSAEAEDHLRNTRITQPAVLTADIALFRLLESLGISPARVAGHSLGEYAACVAAGVLSFAEALYAVSLRGKAMSEIDVPDPGKMASATADEATVARLLEGIPGYLEIANRNGPRQSVVAGETQAVDAFRKRCEEAGIPCVELKVSAAFHSRIVAPAQEPFGRVLRELNLRAPRIPIYANVTGEPYPSGQGAEEEIYRLLRKQFAAPVQWSKIMERMFADGARIFVECGPKRVLANLALMNLEGKPVQVLETHHPKKPGLEQLCLAVARLRANGVSAAWLNESERPVELTGQSAKTQASPAVPQSESKGLEGAGGNGRHAVGPLGRKLEGPSLSARPSPGTAAVVVSGYAVGLPALERRIFDPQNLDDLMQGRGFISALAREEKAKLLEKRVERVEKTEDGGAAFREVSGLDEVIQLAGRRGSFDLVEEYGIEERLLDAMDITSRLAVAAALETLRDAGIPLVRTYGYGARSAGGRLPTGWALPEAMRDDTAVVFASAFPGVDSVVREVSAFLRARLGVEARSIWMDSLSSVLSHLRDPELRDLLGRWFSDGFSRLRAWEADGPYRFSRNFLFKALALGHAHVAQALGARGPALHVNAACASTTEALVVARDWIESGRARRVLVVGADDATNDALLEWIGTGFLAIGAASTKERVEEASLPFDNRRNGTILGMGAVGLLVEAEHEALQRGVVPVARLAGAETGNSAFHLSRLDVDHIAGLMERLVSRWERDTGRDRDSLAGDLLFMSHETFTPKRGGSAQAEIEALRRVFGPRHRDILIANVKGQTGHPLGAGLEDGVVLACLERGEVPPLANFRKVDPELGDLNYSRGGRHGLRYALRLAAGFGSQIGLTLLEHAGRRPNERFLPRYRDWLRETVGCDESGLEVVRNVLRVRQENRASPVVQVDFGPWADRPEQSLAADMPAQGSPAGLAGAAANHEPQAALSEPVPEEFFASPPRASGAMRDVTKEVLALVAEKTGYPEDMLDLDLDLEADLGIDTIKQAELFADLRKKFALPSSERLKIADFPTLRHIIQWVEERKAPSDQQQEARTLPKASLSSVSEADAPQVGRVSSGQVGDSAPEAPETSSGMEQQNECVSFSESTTREVLALVAEKTGYPEDMLDLDLDLEADLGIDTIKQAELFADLRKKFALPSTERLKIADFPTLRHIIGWVDSQRKPSGTESAARNQWTVVTADGQARSGGGVRVLVPVLTALSDGSEGAGRLSPGHVLVAGGPEDLVRLVSQRLQAEGADVLVMEAERFHSGDLQGMEVALGRSGDWDVLNLLGLEKDGAKAVAGTFNLYRMLASRGDPMPRRLLAAIATGGSFLLRDVAPSEEAAASSGGVCGATKAFQQEFREVACTVLDLDRGSSIQEKAQFIVEELFRPGLLEVARDRRGGRFGITLEPAGLPEDAKPQIAPDSVVLATGGARGITAACLKSLLAGCSLRLAVVGRAPEPNPESLNRSVLDETGWAAERQRLIEEARRTAARTGIAEIEAELSRRRREAEIAANLRDFRDAGAAVRYFQADVLDPAAIGRVVDEVKALWGRVDVVIHGAGKDQSKSLAKKTLESMLEIYEIKVGGLRNLKAALGRAGMTPSLWVLFSSVAGRFGNAGQTEYSAANESLNFVARFRSLFGGAPAPRFVAPNWGPWAGVGMAARGGTLEVLRSRGVEALRPDEACKEFKKILAATDIRADVVVSGGVGELAEVGKGEALQTPVEMGSGGGQTFLVPLFDGLPSRSLVFEGGRRFVFALEPNPRKLEFLDHHRIGGTAVLPGVLTLALFAYGAARLAPGSTLRAFEQVVFERPLKFHRDRPVLVEVEVSASGEDQGEGTKAFEACLRSLFTFPGAPGSARHVLHHKARLVVGAPEPLAARVSPGTRASDRTLTCEEIYKWFFHGPRFQVLSRASLQDDRVMEGLLNPLRRKIFDGLKEMLNFPWTGDVEAAFQTAGVRAMTVSGRMGLPGRVDRIQVSSTCGPGARAYAVYRGSNPGPGETVEDLFDVEVVDERGGCVLRLEGLALVGGEDLAIRKGSPSPGSGFHGSGSEPVVVQEVVSVVELQKALRQRGEEFLQEWLAPEEIETFRSWPHETRAWTWLAGRVAAKKAVRRFVLTAEREAPAPRAILVWNDPLGRPFCNREDLLLSISHKEDTAVGAVADARAADGLGVDLERVAPRDPAMIEQFFTAGEQDLARRLDGEAGQAGSGVHFSHLWAVKEAVLKSLGLGLRVDTRQVEVKNLGPDGTAEVALWGLEGKGAVQVCPNDRIRVRVSRENGHVIARSLFDRCRSCRALSEPDPVSEERQDG
jgi:acyl transferase domain-containing protein/phosphopantetheinyl transferase/NAD(P)-dependent dehydrogenase (short-subunit alcohol dehydrogenase family)